MKRMTQGPGIQPINSWWGESAAAWTIAAMLGEIGFWPCLMPSYFRNIGQTIIYYV